MKNSILIEYPMEQFISDFMEILNNSTYKICCSKDFTSSSYFVIDIDWDSSFIYDDRINLQGKGFTAIDLSFNDFKAIRQDDREIGGCYYIYFNKNESDISKYDLVIDITPISN